MSLDKSYIISAFEKLNQALKALNNEIIVLDFSHFSPVDETNQNHYDIYFKSLASTEEYRSKYYRYIENLVKDRRSNWKKYEKGKQKFLYNFDNDNSGENEYEKGVYLNPELDKPNVPVQNNFDAKDHLINDFPQTSSLPGECFIIYSEEHGDAQSIVYVLLKEKISIEGNLEEMVNLLEKLPENLKGFDTELHTLLIHEMVNSLVEEKASLYKQVQDLKTKTMFSLTTHSLKTHLNTTVIKTKNAFRDNKLKPLCSELEEDFEEHSREVDTLFLLTDLLSLIDKIDNKAEFIKAAGKVLFSKSMVSYNLKEHLRKFNERHTADKDIEIEPEIEMFDFSITIYGLYFGEKLLELLFNALFENVIAYGKTGDNDKKKLNITISTNCWTFSNASASKESSSDESKLTGNYALFQKLINETQSGNFSVSSGDYKFEIKIQAENGEE